MRGKRTRKSAPPPGALPAVASPPWTRAIERTIARPSPVPGTIARACLVGAVEALEDVRELLFRDARAAVGHFDPGRLAGSVRRATSTLPRSRELDRVVDEIADELAQQVRVAVDDRRAAYAEVAARSAFRRRAARRSASTSLAICASESGSFGISSPRSAFASVSMPLTMPARSALSRTIVSRLSRRIVRS